MLPGSVCRDLPETSGSENEKYVLGGGGMMEYGIRDAISEAVESFHMPRFEDIPNVGLYLEQTVSYIMEYLSPILDGAVTGSMISNYVKKKLVANPVHKQYDREQIAALFFIVTTKSVLSLENIRILLKIREERYESAAAYNYFCEELENVLKSVFGLKEAEETAPDAEKQVLTEENEDAGKAEEKDILRNTVIALAHKIYLDKWITQYAKN